VSLATLDLAFACLGTMGYPMAGHLARAGHRMTVWNRTTSRAEAWVREHGGRRAGTPAEAARGAACAFVCSGNDDDLGAVVFGAEGLLAGLAPGSLLVDHTTVSAGLAREIDAAASARGVGFLDAPVSGGQSGAAEGALGIMVGGSREAFERAEPLLACYARRSLWLGPAGSGQLAKAVNQICIAGLLEALAEGLRFAVRAGLDAGRVVEIVSQGAAQSWQMDHRARSMLEGRFDFGFAVDWMRKDLDIALAEAGRIGAELPVTALVRRFYEELGARGGGRWDTSSLIARLP